MGAIMKSEKVNIIQGISNIVNNRGVCISTYNIRMENRGVEFLEKIVV